MNVGKLHGKDEGTAKGYLGYLGTNTIQQRDPFAPKRWTVHFSTIKLLFTLAYLLGIMISKQCIFSSCHAFSL